LYDGGCFEKEVDILLKELAILVKEEIEERLRFVSISRISVLLN
jgi:hypothetical protein